MKEMCKYNNSEINSGVKKNNLQKTIKNIENFKKNKKKDNINDDNLISYRLIKTEENDKSLKFLKEKNNMNESNNNYQIYYINNYNNFNCNYDEDSKKFNEDNRKLHMMRKSNKYDTKISRFFENLSVNKRNHSSHDIFRRKDIGELNYNFFELSNQKSFSGENKIKDLNYRKKETNSLERKSKYDNWDIENKNKEKIEILKNASVSTKKIKITVTRKPVKMIIKKKENESNKKSLNQTIDFINYKNEKEFDEKNLDMTNLYVKKKQNTLNPFGITMETNQDQKNIVYIKRNPTPIPKFSRKSQKVFDLNFTENLQYDNKEFSKKSNFEYDIENKKNKSIYLESDNLKSGKFILTHAKKSFYNPNNICKNIFLNSNFSEFKNHDNLSINKIHSSNEDINKKSSNEKKFSYEKKLIDKNKNEKSEKPKENTKISMYEKGHNFSSINKNINLSVKSNETEFDNTNEALINLISLIEAFFKIHPELKINKLNTCDCNNLVLKTSNLKYMEIVHLTFSETKQRKIIDDFFIPFYLLNIIVYRLSVNNEYFNHYISLLIEVLKLITENFIKILNFVLLKFDAIKSEILDLNLLENMRILVNNKALEMSVTNENMNKDKFVNNLRAINFEIKERIKFVTKAYKDEKIEHFFKKYFDLEEILDLKGLRDLYFYKINSSRYYSDKNIIKDYENKNFNMVKRDPIHIDFLKEIEKGSDKNKKRHVRSHSNHVNDIKMFRKYTSKKRFTLVLDMDETLIYLESDNLEYSFDSDKIYGGVLHFRPGLYEFLECLTEHYDLVVFTLATPEYADPILDNLEKGRKYFFQRLYRDDASLYKKEFVKDLSKIENDLSKIAIIDNTEMNFSLQKDNGILIETFLGDENDKYLYYLKDILYEIAMSSENDIRMAIKKRRGEIKRLIHSKN